MYLNLLCLKMITKSWSIHTVGQRALTKIFYFWEFFKVWIHTIPTKKLVEMLKQLVFLSLKMLLNVCILMRSLAGNKMYILWTSIPLACFNIQVNPSGEREAGGNRPPSHKSMVCAKSISKFRVSESYANLSIDISFHAACTVLVPRFQI